MAAHGTGKADMKGAGSGMREAESAGGNSGHWVCRRFPLPASRSPLYCILIHGPTRHMAIPEQETSWTTSHIGPARFRTEIRSRDHFFVADEPFSVGGRDAGPTPYELLLASLGACTAMTLRMYADRKQWPLQDVRVRLRTSGSHAEDCVKCEEDEVGMTTVEREVELSGPLTDEQKTRLLEIADRCPIKQTLARGVRVVAAR